MAKFADLIITLHTRPRSIGFNKKDLTDDHREIISKFAVYIDASEQEEEPTTAEES